LWELRLSWSKRFDEPIELDDGSTLRTLRDAIQYLGKTVPKSERRPKTEVSETPVSSDGDDGGRPLSPPSLASNRARQLAKT
jgi:hypothetical protein